MNLAKEEKGKTKKIPKLNLARSVSDLIRDVERIHERSERVIEELCALERAVALEHSSFPRLRRARIPPAHPGPAPTVQDFHREHKHEKGREVVWFDGKQIALSPTLAELITILASDGGQSPDEFVAWKSLDLIGQLLEKLLGRRFSHHNVSNLLYNLRGRLKTAGLDGRLIESATSLGARLRLKRRSVSLCAE